LTSLQEALPGWEIAVVNGATAASLARDWNPGAADLLVVNARAEVAETLGLCRFLAFSNSYSRDSREDMVDALNLRRGLAEPSRQANASVLVLVPTGQETLVKVALESGAHNCLMLPIHAKQVVSMLHHLRSGNQPGRHTLNLERAQTEDRWRDDGGQG
jgi:hypothetical protein